jgi:hypothetical protein
MVRLSLECLEQRALLSFLPPVDYGTPSGSASLVTADFTRPGVPDLIAGNADGLTLLRGRGNGVFESPVNLPFNVNFSGLAVGDFNGDGRPDLVALDPGRQAVAVLLNDGRGSFAPPVDVPAGIAPTAVAVGDFTGAGVDSIVAVSGFPGQVSVLVNNGDGTFQKPVLYASDPVPSWVAVADLHGDGILDFVVANSDGLGGQPNIATFLGNGDGTFQPGPSYDVAGFPFSVAVADVNGDGVPDLIVPNSGRSSLSVFLGNGDGTFQQPPVVTPTRHDPYLVAVADFDQDGIPDLAVWNELGLGATQYLDIYLGNGDGSFRVEEESALPGLGTAVSVGLAADFNGDGYPDLAYTNPSFHTIGVRLNDTVWPPLPPPAAGRGLADAVFAAEDRTAEPTETPLPRDTRGPDRRDSAAGLPTGSRPREETPSTEIGLRVVLGRSTGFSDGIYHFFSLAGPIGDALMEGEWPGIG